MATQMTKSQLIEKIAAETELPKKGVKEVFETLATIGYKELKRTGVFLVPGFAKFVVIKKPATKEREGTNSLHQRADDIQGQASPENRAGTPGQSGKRRGVRAALPSGADGSPLGALGGRRDFTSNPVKIPRTLGRGSTPSEDRVLGDVQVAP